MSNCIDEGTIQSFLDGELSGSLAEGVTRHISLCDQCAMAVAEAEEETAFAYSALDRELDSLVPTQRLWSKINISIEEHAKKQSVWQSVKIFLLNPSAVGFAGLLIVFGLFIGLYSMRSGSDLSPVAGISDSNSVNQKTAPVQMVPAAISAESTENGRLEEDPKPVREVRFTAQRAVYDRSEPVRRRAAPAQNSKLSEAAFYSETVNAEETYLKTIATLENTVAAQKDTVMNPSARFSFEKDLAVADDTIKKLRREVRSNPGNEAARVLLKTSYQNKIDLLNSLAEKSELMASLN